MPLRTFVLDMDPFHAPPADLVTQQQQIAMLANTIAQLQAQLNALPAPAPPPRPLVDKPSKPNTFDGKNLNYARTWLAEMEQYFRAIAPHNELNKVNFAAAQLRGAAAEWWASVAPTDEQLAAAAVAPTAHPTVIHTWEKFKEAFLLIHNPVPVKNAARAALFKLKQTDGVQKYVSEFRYWSQLLQDSMDEETKVFMFQQGLKHYLQTHLRIVKPTTLIEAMSEAIQRELVDANDEGRNRWNAKKNDQQGQNFNRRPQQWGNRTITTTTVRDANGPAPMELGNVETGNV